MKPRKMHEPGHFICAPACRWFIHHHVGKWCVSSVGDYRPSRSPDEAADVGHGRFYETMVFDTTKPEGRGRWNEVAFSGYQGADEARAGHFEMLAKFRKRAERARARARR